jgi:orotate phosphoribosyltransferase
LAPKVLSIERQEMRRELAADLGRGGYVLQVSHGPEVQRYFEKALVLCRPGLLARAADLISDLLPEACERIGVNGVPACALGTALSLASGVPLLLGWAAPDGRPRFEGDLHRAAQVVLLEDVVFTGQRALQGAQELVARGAEVLGILCLLDRDCGGSRVLAEAGFGLRPLFTEKELLATAHGAGI